MQLDSVSVLAAFNYAGRILVLVEIDNRYRTLMYRSSGYNSSFQSYIPFAGLLGPNQLDIADRFWQMQPGWLVKLACWSDKLEPYKLEYQSFTGDYTNRLDRLSFTKAPFSFLDLSDFLDQYQDSIFVTANLDHTNIEDISDFNYIANLFLQQR